MNSDNADRALERPREAGERVSANLVELEIDSSRQLLEATTLAGESALRWAAASAELTNLWEWRGLLDAFLAHAGELRRSARNASEFKEWLTGASIELARANVPLAERDLLGRSEVTVRCTADELLERMSRAFDEVKTVVGAFGQAWDTLTPRLSAARKALEEARAFATSVGESERTDLAAAAERVARLTRALSSDPLSVAPADVDRLCDSLHAIQRDLEATAALRRDLEARLGETRTLLRSLRAAVEQGRVAHDELVVKIAVPSAPAVPEIEADLDGELDRIAALAASGEWREARDRLVRLTARAGGQLEEAERVLRATRAPIEARNQLRSLLEAYQVKAERLGRVEEPELERIFAQAHQALYTAPTDLALVAQLVRRYQELLNAALPTPERVR